MVEAIFNLKIIFQLGLWRETLWLYWSSHPRPWESWIQWRAPVLPHNLTPGSSECGLFPLSLPSSYCLQKEAEYLSFHWNLVLCSMAHQSSKITVFCGTSEHELKPYLISSKLTRRWALYLCPKILRTQAHEIFIIQHIFIQLGGVLADWLYDCGLLNPYPIWLTTNILNWDAFQNW